MKNLCLLLFCLLGILQLPTQAQPNLDDFTINYTDLKSTKAMVVSSHKINLLNTGKKVQFLLTQATGTELVLSDGTTFQKDGSIRILDLTPVLQRGLADRTASITIKDMSSIGQGKVVGAITFSYDTDTPPQTSFSPKHSSRDGLVNTILTLDMCPNPQRLSITGKDGLPRKKLFVKNNEVIELRIIHSNPLRYTIAIAGSFEAFNTNGSGLDTALRPTPATTEKTAKEQIESVQILLTTAPGLTTEIQGYKKTMSQESCIDEASVRNRIEDFNKRVRSLVGNVQNLSSLAAAKLNKAETLLKNMPEGDEKTNTQHKLQSTRTQLNTSETLADLQALEQELILLQGIDFKVYTFPYEVTGKNIDLVRFDVEQKFKNTAIPNQTVTYDVYLRGGIKIDFSAGIFMSGLIDDAYLIRDDSVRLTANKPRTAGKLLIKENSSATAFSFGTLMHVYTRFGLVNPSLSWGVALTSQQKFQILTGASLLLGREQRLAISGGVTWGSVKRISAIYKTDLDNNLYLDGTNTPVSLIDKMEHSWFVGLTYNLTKTKVAGK